MSVDAVKQTRLAFPGHKESQESQKLRLYKLLLQKYSDLINEKERKTVGEIKDLVSADDLTIQSIIQDFRKPDYGFSSDYLETAKKIFEFVSEEIGFVEAGVSINFWLSPKEIFSSKVADDEDLAVFLCSLLFGLGDGQAEVVIAELENLKTHAFVLTNHKGVFFILDPAQKHDFLAFSGTMEECLKKYSFNGAKLKRFLYKFNHSKYEQLM